jgi:excisionase family DNA binding protein
MAHTSTGANLRRSTRGLERAPLAVGKAEAAQLLGVSEDYLDKHIRPEIRVARVGRRVLFPVNELGGWLNEHASRPLS